jgi:hypothetical protein
MTEPLQIIRDYVAAEKIAVGKMDLRGVDSVSEIGDSVLALATYSDGAKVFQQWLIELTLVDKNAKESKAAAEKTQTLYTNTGGHYEFRSSRSALALRTIGPFTKETKLTDKIPVLKARSLVSTEYLGIGLNLTAEALIKIRSKAATANKEKHRFSLDTSGVRFSDARIEEGKRIAQLYEITPDNDRAFAASIPALMEFFNAVRRAPGLNSILFQILEKPSVWSLVTKGGLDVSLNLNMNGTQLVDKIGPDTLYKLPVTLVLNKQAALKTQLFVCTPRPPLRNSAGVFGIIAQHPSGKGVIDPQVLVIRIVNSSHRALTEKEALEISNTSSDPALDNETSSTATPNAVPGSPSVSKSENSAPQNAPLLAQNTQPPVPSPQSSQLSPSAALQSASTAPQPPKSGKTKAPPRVTATSGGP